MEDIGDLLFYILAGLFAIIGAISRSKKGRKVVFPGNTTGNDPFPNIPGMGGSRPDMNIPADEESYEWDDTVSPEYDGSVDMNMVGDGAGTYLSKSTIEDNYIEPMASLIPEEGISSAMEVDPESLKWVIQDEISLINMDEESGEESIVNTLAEGFNLPEAIVWSEIINRKEFF